MHLMILVSCRFLSILYNAHHIVTVFHILTQKSIPQFISVLSSSVLDSSEVATAEQSKDSNFNVSVYFIV